MLLGNFRLDGSPDGRSLTRGELLAEFVLGVFACQDGFQIERPPTPAEARGVVSIGSLPGASNY
jgi:hypothetical protein